MKKYRVTIPFPVFISIDVEAESMVDAEDIALNEVVLISYAGNGGTDKLVGVSGSNMSIEPGEMHIDTGGYDINIEEL